MTELFRIGDTALYVTGGVEEEVFLRWAPGEAGSIAMDQTWADSGLPGICGYYVFLDSLPPAADAAALEAALRSALPAPTATGFAWVAWSAGHANFYGSVPLAVGEHGQPTVTTDVSLRLPPGALQYTLAKGMVAAATRGDGLNGLVLTLDPPGPGRAGLRVPLLGPLWGCLLHQGLRGSRVDGDHSVKELAEVRLDPLRLTNPERTCVRELGERYLLREPLPGSYTLAPLP